MTNLATTITIGICGSNKIKISDDVIDAGQCLNQTNFDRIVIFLKTMLTDVNIYSEFKLKFLNMEIGSGHCNYMFYLTSIDNSTYGDAHLLRSMKAYADQFFVLTVRDDVIECDDDNVIYVDDEVENQYRELEKSLEEYNDKLYHCFKIDIKLANIFNKINTDNTIANLLEYEIDLLASCLIKKSSKLSLADKKIQLKRSLKKIDIQDKLADTGYTELHDTIIGYFKIARQKKLVCYNYLYAFAHMQPKVDSDSLVAMVDEIYSIKYMNKEMYDILIKKIGEKLLTKLQAYYKECANVVVVNPNQICKIDVYSYHKFLTNIVTMATKHKLDNIVELTVNEIKSIDGLILEHQSSQVDKETDLVKLSAYFDVIETKDKAVITTFDKIMANSSIIDSNVTIEKSNQWIDFIGKCISRNISKESIIILASTIIMSRIAYYTDNSRISSSDITVIYPHCLQTILLLYINNDAFIFKKLYMYLSCHMRYSSRNVIANIIHIDAAQYDAMMNLEIWIFKYITSSN